jgi:hypothetical protein
MTPRQHRRQIKRLSRLEVEEALRVGGLFPSTPRSDGERLRRWLLWRRLDRLVRHRWLDDDRWLDRPCASASQPADQTEQ